MEDMNLKLYKFLKENVDINTIYESNIKNVLKEEKEILTEDIKLTQLKNNLEKIYTGTGFEFGYTTESGVAYGNGYGDTALREVYVDLKDNKIHYSYTTETESIEKEFPIEDVSKLEGVIPTTIEQFDSKIKEEVKPESKIEEPVVDSMEEKLKSLTQEYTLSINEKDKKEIKKKAKDILNKKYKSDKKCMKEAYIEATYEYLNATTPMNTNNPEDMKEKEETRIVLAKGVSDKLVADEIAKDKKGSVITDEDDKEKFMVIAKEHVKESKVQNLIADIAKESKKSIADVVKALGKVKTDYMKEIGKNNDELTDEDNKILINRTVEVLGESIKEKTAKIISKKLALGVGDVIVTDTNETFKIINIDNSKCVVEKVLDEASNAIKGISQEVNLKSNEVEKIWKDVEKEYLKDKDKKKKELEDKDWKYIAGVTKKIAKAKVKKVAKESIKK